MNKTINKLSLTFIMLYLLTGCMTKPHDHQIRTAISNFTEQVSLSNIFAIRNVAQTQAINGQGIYYIDITYERHCLMNNEDSMQQLSKSYNKDLNSYTTLSNTKYNRDALSLKRHILDEKKLNLVKKYGNFRSGDIIFESARLKFVNTEAGWYMSSHQSESQQPILTAEL